MARCFFALTQRTYNWYGKTYWKMRCATAPKAEWLRWLSRARMEDRHGLSSKTTASVSPLTSCRMFLRDSIEEIHPEPVPLAVFGLGLPSRKRRSEGMAGPLL